MYCENILQPKLMGNIYLEKTLTSYHLRTVQAVEGFFMTYNRFVSKQKSTQTNFELLFK